MQTPIIRLLRRLLIGLIVVVSLAILLNYFHVWRIRSAAVKPQAEILSPEWMRSAERPEITSWDNGVMKFRLRAQKLLETRAGESHFEGIEANDYNPDGSIRNQISSREAMYYPEKKQVFFSGDVRLGLGKDVFLRMESLHYDHGSQSGYSDDALQLTSARVTGTARGVRYDNAHRRLQLLSNLDFIVHAPVADVKAADGSSDYRITAGSGYYSEAEHLLRLEDGANIASATGALSGRTVEITFSDDNRRLAGLVCTGEGKYRFMDPTGERTLKGERLAFRLDEASRALADILAQGEAAFSSQSAEADQTLLASEIRLEMNPDGSLPQRLESRSNVRFEFMRGTQNTRIQGDRLEAAFSASGNGIENMTVRDHASVIMTGNGEETDDLRAEEIAIAFRPREGQSVPFELQAHRSVRWSATARTNARESGDAARLLTASSLVMRYAEAGNSLASGSAAGGVALEIAPETGAKPSQVRRMNCDDLVFDFFPGQNRLEDLAGTGNVSVIYRESGGSGSGSKITEYRTSSASLAARFRAEDGSPESITQSGAFRYEDDQRTAFSDVCKFDALRGILVMTGDPVVRDSQSSTSGELVEYDRAGRTMTVRRNVRSELAPPKGESRSPLAGSTQATSGESLITADEMRYWIDQGRVVYRGEVLLLSTESQLQAESLEIVNSGERIEATGSVSHRILDFGDTRPAPAGKEAEGRAAKELSNVMAGGQALIRSARLLYQQSSNRMQYSGDVFFASENAKLYTDFLEVSFDPEGKNVEQAAATGHLRITQPGREIKGETAEYFPAAGKFVVTGNPAQIVGYAKGKSEAPRLTIFTTDDRILLENK